MPTDRQEFLDVAFDVLPVEALVPRLARVRADSPFAYLVTPNVDHLVRLHRTASELPQIAQIYRDADYCICDSKVLARLAKWRSVDLPVVPGSDLTEILFKDVIAAGDRIAVIGGDADTIGGLRSKFPGVEFVQHLPPMGLLRDAAARRKAAEFIAEQKPRFTFICVGAPQQEMIASEAARLDGSTGLALCVGAALDFLTDREKRAPALMRRFGLEWAHRLLSNPRRLWRRYLIEGPAIFILAYRWKRSAA
jgi:N-acetylglucosaminyldiphosphoundecaprenol N-acetyl-beta-D-mannosaminyltransferase